MIEMYKKDLTLQQLVGYFKETFKLVLPFQLLNILKQLKRNEHFDYEILQRNRIIFPPEVEEAIYIMMAMDMFKSFYERGLLTKEEYDEFEKEGEKLWRNALKGDSMPTNRLKRRETA